MRTPGKRKHSEDEKRSMFKGIRWKLECMVVLVTVFSVFLSGTFFGLYEIRNEKQAFCAQMSRAVREGNNAYRSLQIVSGDGETVPTVWETVHRELVRQGGVQEVRLYILRTNGTVLYDENGVWRSEWDAALPFGITDNIKMAVGGQEGNQCCVWDKIVDYAFSILGNEGEIEGVIYAAEAPHKLQQTIQQSMQLVGQACLLSLVIALLAGILIARMVTKPIRRLTEKAKQIAGGEFDAEVKIASRDEIGRLSRTLDEMATELQSNLSDIEEEKNKLETIQTFMSDGVMAFDAAGNLIHINRAAAKMLEIPMDDAMQFDTYFHSIGIQISIAELVFKSETVLQRYYEKDGRHIEMLFARMSKGEKTTGVITMLHDVTRQQKLDASRREFVANVSHELRTPITTIKSYTETVMETEDLPREVQKRFLGVVEKEADRMTRLIHDLLTLSGLDHDKASTKKEPFDLAKLIADVVDKLQMDTKPGQTVTYTQISKLPRFVGNSDRMEQVLTNVISNAVKYTPENGTINVFSGYIYDYIYVKVQDTGIGIPQKSLPHVFERFYRADKARSRNEGGTGLGLAIAKEIVEEHGGNISITSEQGQGTEVLVKFPLNAMSNEIK